MGGRYKREATQRFCADLSDEQTSKLEKLAQLYNTTKAGVVTRLIDAASIPDRSPGPDGKPKEQLCVCNGERRVVAILPSV